MRSALEFSALDFVFLNIQKGGRISGVSVDAKTYDEMYQQLLVRRQREGRPFWVDEYGCPIVGGVPVRVWEQNA